MFLYNMKRGACESTPFMYRGLLHGDAFCSMSRRTDFYIAM